MQVNPRLRPILIISIIAVLVFIVLAVITSIRRARIVAEDGERYAAILRGFLGEENGKDASQVTFAGDAPPDLISIGVYDGFYRTPLMLLISAPDPDPELCRLILLCEARRLSENVIFAPDPYYRRVYERLTRACATEAAPAEIRYAAARCNLAVGNFDTARGLLHKLLAESETGGTADPIYGDWLLQCLTMSGLLNGDVEAATDRARQQWEAAPMDEYRGSDLVKTALRTGRYDLAADLLGEVNDYYERCGSPGLTDRDALSLQIERDSHDLAGYLSCLVRQVDMFAVRPAEYRTPITVLVLLDEAGYSVPAELAGLLKADRPKIIDAPPAGLVEAYLLTGDARFLDRLHMGLLNAYQEYLYSQEATVKQIKPNVYEVIVNGKTVQYSDISSGVQANPEEEVRRQVVGRMMSSLQEALSHYLDACRLSGDWEAVNREGLGEIFNAATQAPDPHRNSAHPLERQTGALPRQRGLLLKRVACNEPILHWDIGYEELAYLVESGELAWALNTPGFATAAAHAGVTTAEARQRVLRELGLSGGH